MLYDLTSSYVEGQAESNSMMKRGYSREGAYLLRTNLKGEGPEKYTQLTEAEAAVRALESELSIRPIFHQVG